MPIRVTDTRPLFRPLCHDIVALLGSLSPSDWERPTMASAWRVRDVVAHMLDTALRRLSFHRDGMAPPSPSKPPVSERDFVAFINELNVTWVRAAARLSPRVLSDLYRRTSGELCDFVEAFPDDGAALFPVSWAGEHESTALLDIGREFTEVWHHGAQVRDASGAGPYPDPHWLRAVLEIAMHALPHAYRRVRAKTGNSLAIQITGPSGGAWTLRRLDAGWDISPGADVGATARAAIADDRAWRLFFNALPPAEAERALNLDGDVELARHLAGVRSVIV